MALFKIKLFKEKEEKKYYCIKCKNQLLPGRKRKFCDAKCRSQYYSAMQYAREKENPEYMKKRIVYHKQWRKKNHEKFNAIMRKASKEYQRRLRQKQKIEKMKQKEVKDGSR